MPGKELEELQKVYVESEIINYNYHLHLYQKYKLEIERLTRMIKVGPSSSSGSVIAMPEENNHSQEAENIHLGRLIDELEEKMAYEKSKVDMVDTWLQECCNTENQRRIIQVYMIENQSKKLEETAKELCCSRENVLKIRKRVLKRIISYENL